jgi:hypothetical protein
MTKKYIIQSVDDLAGSMVVEFIDDSQTTSLNIRVPPDGTTVDEQVNNCWPAFVIISSSGISAATALIGQTITVGEPTLDQIKATQIGNLTTSANNQINSGYTSNALGAPYTYPSTSIAQANMMASVIDSLRIPADWAASTLYVVGTSIMAGSTRLLCSTGGTSGSDVPDGPGTDGTAAWVDWYTPFSCTDSNNVTAFVPHTATQIQQAGADGKLMVQSVYEKLGELVSYVEAATTQSDVALVTWVFP